MRAIVADAPGGPEVLELKDVPLPEPGPGKARIRVAYADLNPLDTHARGSASSGTLPLFRLLPGYEYSGIVAAKARMPRSSGAAWRRWANGAAAPSTRSPPRRA